MTPSRRSVVLAGPVGLLTTLLAGCTGSTRRAPSLPRPTDPDVALRAAAAARERALVAALDRALLTAAGTPAGLLLADLRREHLVHLGALEPRSAEPPPSTTPPSTTAPPTTSPPTTPRATVPPATAAPADAESQQRLRRAQAARERAAATAHAAATRTASPRLAALLAQLAASEASHAAVL